MDHQCRVPLWQRLSDLRLSDLCLTPSPQAPPPGLAIEPPQPAVRSDPLTVQETDLERRCLSMLTTALRAIISYAHSSYHVSIHFQVKRFDKAHGQVWVKVNPDEVPEGYDLKYLLQHIKFYENMPRYAELLCTDDFKLRSTCQYFLDLQTRAGGNKLAELGSPGDLKGSRVRETVAKAAKWVQEMLDVGLADRDVTRQLTEAQRCLRELGYAVQKFSVFQQNRTEAVRLTSTWYPEKQQLAARSVHQQMQSVLDDPEVVKYMLHVVGPRLGIVPFQFPAQY